MINQDIKITSTILYVVCIYVWFIGELVGNMRELIHHGRIVFSEFVATALPNGDGEAFAFCLALVETRGEEWWWTTVLAVLRCDRSIRIYICIIIFNQRIILKLRAWLSQSLTFYEISNSKIGFRHFFLCGNRYYFKTEFWSRCGII